MTNFQVGDFVRVTDDRYPNCAVEGEVIDLEYLYFSNAITVSSIWNKVSHFNLNFVEVTVLARVEPKELGHIHKEWIRWTTAEEFGYPWINTRTSVMGDWESVLVQTEDEQC